MRKIVNWLDYMDENFNDHFKSLEGIEKVYDNRAYDFVDNLWEDLEPDEMGDYDKDAIHDAKLVNEAFGEEYYPIPKGK